MPPPQLDGLIDAAARSDRLAVVLSQMARAASGGQAAYLPWDRLRFRTPPDGLSPQEWWLSIRMSRRSTERLLPSLTDVEGRPFRFSLPDQLLEGVDAINRGAGGQIAMGEQVTNPATRDRYVVSSLFEEAIRSSQLEGAATTRQVAKEMLRTGRPPRDRSERMILNNYRAMRAIGERRHESLTPALVCEIHRVVTEETLTDPCAPGVLQSPSDERIAVYSDTGDLLHRPPPAEQLPERLERLCGFANAATDDGYVPPVLRAMAVHFMMGYDHYFADGNGRTARAVFYWSMLNQGYWLTEFLTISRIIKAAPVPYARAFLDSEQDDGDLTYFFLHQAAVIRRAMHDLETYLQRKTEELRAVQHTIRALPGEFNHRELALIDHAVRNPGTRYTVVSHQTSHAVSQQTARADLLHLERVGYLRSQRVGKRVEWSSPADLAARVTGHHGGAREDRASGTSS